MRPIVLSSRSIIGVRCPLALAVALGAARGQVAVAVPNGEQVDSDGDRMAELAQAAVMQFKMELRNEKVYLGELRKRSAYERRNLNRPFYDRFTRKGRRH